MYLEQMLKPNLFFLSVKLLSEKLQNDLLNVSFDTVHKTYPSNISH